MITLYAGIIYLLGFVASYFMCRRNFRVLDGRYTVGNRITSFVISAFSWIGFLFAIMSAIIEHISDKIDQKKSAKW